MVYFCDDLFLKAIIEENPLKRLVYMACNNAATYFLIKGRTAKPFNPLLGETYELITPKYRFYSEAVCHHPPMLAINCQGVGWELNKTVVTVIKFNGRKVQCEDFYPTKVTIDAPDGKEEYEMYTPKLYVGNLLIGERYIEPAGKVVVKNKTTGDYCDMEYKSRDDGLFTSGKKQNIDSIEGFIKNKEGTPFFKLFGKFTEKI